VGVFPTQALVNQGSGLSAQKREKKKKRKEILPIRREEQAQTSMQPFVTAESALGRRYIWRGHGGSPGERSASQEGLQSDLREAHLWHPGALDLWWKRGRAKRSQVSVNRCIWIQSKKGH
jgi:hypothetical protein